jgi:antitoxin PrlF
MESAITVKGQTTIPKAIRERLGLKPGDRVRFFIDPDGHAAFLPVRPISDLKGMVKSSGPPISAEDMDEAVAQGVAERYRRSVR